jgi:CheY-like chemotaxis protein
MSRILVIDDNEDLREMMHLILSADGHEVETASDGLGGLGRLREARFDLVVTDIFMPDQDGIETITQVREHFPSVRIVAISGGGRASRAKSYLRTAIEIGADAAIPKPFEQSELCATVRWVLAK